jgi:hypothetical protein
MVLGDALSVEKTTRVSEWRRIVTRVASALVVGFQCTEYVVSADWLGLVRIRRPGCA